VKVEDHIVVPMLDPVAVAANPDQSVEDYVASLFTLPMDRSRPLWEFHFLDFPTSDAMSTAVFRVHHSLGDGMSLLTLLMSSTRSAADPSRLPAMPTPPARSGDIYARPRPPRSAGVLAFIAWLWSFVVLAWHTVVDVTLFVADFDTETALRKRDPDRVIGTIRKMSDGKKRSYSGDILMSVTLTVVTGLVLVFSETARKTLLDTVFGAEEEFVYTSTTSGEGTPQTNGTPVGES
jgi:hypothetical protein